MLNHFDYKISRVSVMWVHRRSISRVKIEELSGSKRQNTRAEESRSKIWFFTMGVWF
jgi:hypothetical protein